MLANRKNDEDTDIMAIRRRKLIFKRLIVSHYV